MGSTTFEEFKEKYLQEDEDYLGPGWCPIADEYTMFYHPDGFDLYRRLVLFFDEDKMWVLNPEMVCADEDVLKAHLEESSEYNQSKGVNTLYDVYHYDDNPDLFDRITIFKIDRMGVGPDS